MAQTSHLTFQLYEAVTTKEENEDFSISKITKHTLDQKKKQGNCEQSVKILNYELSFHILLTFFPVYSKHFLI